MRNQWVRSHPNMKLYELQYGETITKCNVEFELTLEPKARDMTERERFGMPRHAAKFCPFCGVQHLNINYEYGDEPLDEEA